MDRENIRRSEKEAREEVVSNTSDEVRATVHGTVRNVRNSAMEHRVSVQDEIESAEAGKEKD
ncbi:hypothetical protein GCM10010403_24500 [Glycomyces rutgersensis]|uniref:CsbD-like n=1 Tax=Glycomyces rutgersensis TaxID=58115 RepID=A0ABN3FJW6_9ACTN